MSGKEKANIDEHYLREIMETYGTPLLKLVYTYVKNWTTAEDIVQETFITFFQKYHLFQGRSSLKTWLFRIAINKSKDYLRSPKNKFSPQILSNKLFSKNRSPDEVLIDKDESQLITTSLFNLQIKYREVLNLFYYEDLSIKEISIVLSINESTVKTRLLRGRDKLKQNYLKEVGGHGRTFEQVKNIIR